MLVDLHAERRQQEYLLQQIQDMVEVMIMKRYL
jgi:hypothetical protein